jgi:NRAMP (natural resistance-associated macrophage protein)-like metal ion transporter
MEIIQNNTDHNEKFFSMSEFRHMAGIPLIVARKLVVWGEVKAVKTIDGTVVIAETEVIRVMELAKNPWKKMHLFFRALGPGLITGASDDDPSGIGTYSSVGAKFGLGILWMAIWLLPMMMAIQEACARIGIVTNHGLAGVLQRHYKKRIVGGIVVLLIIANVVNIGADLGAMASALNMLTHINFYIAALLFAVVSIVCEIFIGYRIYVRVLKWLSISVLAYVVTGFIIHPMWREIFHFAFVPQFLPDESYVFAMIAVFGTSITPYLFFWQTSEEVEENRMEKRTAITPLKKEKHGLTTKIRKMRTDVGTGMFLANSVFFFIIITTAQVLHQNGIYNIESADQAAMALRPLAGEYAFLLFSIGLICTGMLAVPILAGSGAYALAEVMKWHEGLEEKFSHAKGFYMIIIISILFGLSLNFFHINPITALYYAAFINGVIALPLLVVIMIVGDDKQIMGKETHPWWVRVCGWASIVFVMCLIIAAIFLLIL